MKRITLLINSLAGGGAEGVCINVANNLAKRGWEVDLLVLNLKDTAYLDRVAEQVKLVNLKSANARYAFLPLKRYIKQNEPNKILVFNYELAVILVLIRKIYPLRFKIIARNINTLSRNIQSSSTFWRTHIVKPFINRFYCDVDHVINQCQAMENDLLETFPQLKNKTSVIFNPVNSAIENQATKVNIEKAEKQDYFLCIGRLEEQKAFHYAMEAFSKIAENFPTLRLKIVGQGSLEATLKAEAEKLGIANKVDFEGFQKNISAYYLHADATLLTSLYEGFPNVLIESITLGTPVVAFDCPSGPSEIIKNGINGYLIEDKNINLFAVALKKLKDYPLSSESVISTSTPYRTNEVIKHYERIIREI